MDQLWDWIIANRQWVFSGIGVFVLGLLLSWFRSKRKASDGDLIITHGEQSPGKVGRDYIAGVGGTRPKEREPKIRRADKDQGATIDTEGDGIPNRDQ